MVRPWVCLYIVSERKKQCIPQWQRNGIYKGQETRGVFRGFPGSEKQKNWLAKGTTITGIYKSMKQ